MGHFLPVFFWSLFPTINKYARLLFSSYLCKTASLGLSSFLLLLVHLLNSACFDGAGSYLREVWWHIHSTPTGKTLGTSRLVPAQPSTTALHDPHNACKHTGSCTSQKQFSCACSVKYASKAGLANMGTAPQRWGLCYVWCQPQANPTAASSHSCNVCAFPMS